MTESITRNHGNENFKIIIKTDSVEHYKANYSMREIEQMYIAKGWKRANKSAGTGFVTITFRHNPQMKSSEKDSDK